VIFAFLAATSVLLGALVFLVSSNGIVAALSTIGTFSIGATLNAMVAAEWRKRADAYAAAAQGRESETIELAPGGHDPKVLATEVKSTFDSARRMKSKVSQLNMVIDGLAEGVLLTDVRGIVVEQNPAMKQLVKSTLIGKSAFDVFPEIKMPVEIACTKNQVTRLELERETPSRQVLSVHVAPLAQGVGASAIFFDITELRRLEQVRTDFVANVSHELRTPLASVRGYAETLQAGAIFDSNVAPNMVAVIHRQAIRLSELVDDLLQLSKLESKAFVLERKPIPVRDMLMRVVESMEVGAQKRVEITILDNISVCGDARALEQVFLNLLDNAVRHSDTSAKVVVAARIEKEIVELLVTDSGSGIATEHLGRLFERFYRVDKGRSRDAGGTGLGLSIVKHLVTTMGGDVSVQSTLGKGSTFIVRLTTVSDSTL
jgi:two-component system, OmpR family, phosphate regulon sensor histidine kinase PhoR